MQGKRGFWQEELGLDLGSACLRVWVRGRGLVLEEPSVLAVERKTGRFCALGREAEALLAEAPKMHYPLYPLRAGIISDYRETLALLRLLLGRVQGRALRKPKVSLAVPKHIRPIEAQALLAATVQAGAGAVALVEAPLLQALGLGLEVQDPRAHCLVDVGAGGCHIAVLALGQVLAYHDCPQGGTAFDRALMQALRQRQQVFVSRAMMEREKCRLGEEAGALVCTGYAFADANQTRCVLERAEVREIFAPLWADLATGIAGLLADLPPCILEDIEAEGLYLTGGGSLLWGLAEDLQARLSLPVQTVAEPDRLTVAGMAQHMPRYQKKPRR